MMKPEPPATCLRSSGVRGRGPKKNSKGSPWKGELRPDESLTISVDTIETTEGRAPLAMAANEGIVPAAADTDGGSFLAATRGVRWSVPVSTAPATTAAAATAR